jgi:hypothetical protein
LQHVNQYYNGSPELRTRPTGRLLQDYETGDVESVWSAAESFARLNEDFRQEAEGVARLMMTRVRRNAEILAERLTQLGWKPLYGRMAGTPAERPFPGEDQARALGAWPIPIALSAFWEIVGSINFVWDYYLGQEPDLFGGVPRLKLDPLCVDGADRLPFLVEDWKDMIETGAVPVGGPFPLDLAPDHYHKANFSGGPPYGVMLPDDSGDPMFRGDDFAVRFVSYLRQSFRWAGFPGLALLQPNPRIADRVTELTKGLLPF